MPKNEMTRRAALLSFSAFAAAGLSGCNTTPTAGVQPAAANGLGIGPINVDTSPLVAYVGNPTAGWAQQALARRARPGSRDQGRPAGPRSTSASTLSISAAADRPIPTG